MNNYLMSFMNQTIDSIKMLFGYVSILPSLTQKKGLRILVQQYVQQLSVTCLIFTVIHC